MVYGRELQGLLVVVTIRYFSPAPALRGLISSYYWFETSRPLLRDQMRAELGQVRFMLDGRMRCRFDNGRQVECPKAMLIGPTASTVATEANGPFRLFGAGLMPAGWSMLIGEPADLLADNVVDLRGVTDRSADHALEALASATSDVGRIVAADRFFLQLATRARPVPLWFTHMADEWLVASADPQIDALVAATGMSNRQVERWTKRYYGASPKLMARKYRTLQAAVRLGNGDAASWTDAAGDAFYDQSHFIREFKQFVGTTPARFVADAAPVSRLTIARRRMMPDLPKLALYS
ncbi:helix-turn-helix domain-containing protein [Glacieibacterium sp.]|uniref:helix-turn-helix domain-containing protein n=1 Tax=Glacieibacterium sp. TaxID=2860237 RepID=UPI003AFFE03E